MKNIWQEDVTALFDATGIVVSKPVIASFCEATYEYDKNPKANWLFYAFLAFVRLATLIKKPEAIAIVGAGPGLDGIATYETLHPEEMTLTEVNPNGLDVPRMNLKRYFTAVGAKVKWSVVLGNLCRPLRPNTQDMTYGNIPTIPGDPATLFQGMNSSSYFDPAWAERCPDNLAQNYLGLQYELLRENRVVLKSGGSALVALGIRMKASVVDKLFQESGIGDYEALVLDVKEQSQPEVVVGSYAKLERETGTQFDFYRGDVVDSKLNGNLPLKEFKQSLEDWRISAAQALKLVLSGQKVHHVVSVLRAVK